MTIPLTQQEFITRLDASERQVRRLPWGICFAITCGATGYAVWLAVLLVRYFDTDARAAILWQLAVCAALFSITPVVDWAWKRRLIRQGLRCPSCRGFLVGETGRVAAETGCCQSCGERVYDRAA